MTRGDWGGKIPPPQLWKIAAGGPRGKKKKEGKKGKRRKGEREKKGKEGKRKEKKEGKRRKGRENSKLKIFRSGSGSSQDRCTLAGGPG